MHVKQTGGRPERITLEALKMFKIKLTEKLEKV